MGLESIFKILFSFVLLLNLDCSKTKSVDLTTNFKKNQINKFDERIKNFDYVIGFEWEGDFTDSNILSNLSKTEYAKYIQDFDFIWEGNIQGLGSSKVYKIILNGEQPGMYRGNKILLLNKEARKGYILWLDKFEPLHLNTKDVYYDIGGRESFKRYGNFYIYKMSRDTLFKIFESDKLVTSSRIDECKRYKKGDLILSSIDIDHNGLNDIIFEGIEYNFCDGLNDEILEKPKDSLMVRLVYKTEVSNNNYIFVKQ